MQDFIQIENPKDNPFVKVSEEENLVEEIENLEEQIKLLKEEIRKLNKKDPEYQALEITVSNYIKKIKENEKYLVENTKRIPVLTEKEIDQQVEIISEFLINVHPFLNEEKFSECCIELRAISRARAYYLKPLNLWRLDSKGKEYLKKWLEKANGKPFCLYWSVRKMEGTGHITNQKAKELSTIVLDFDKCDEIEYRRYINFFRRLRISTTSVMTGSGYQISIRLKNQNVREEEIKRFLNILYEKGFSHIDLKTYDSARVMRLPATVNNKGWMYYKSKKTKLIELSKEKYNFYDIVERFKTFSTVNMKDEDVEQITLLEKAIGDSNRAEKMDKQPILSKKTKQGLEKKIKPLELSDSVLGELQERYHMINVKALNKNVQRMLYKTYNGTKNKALLFMLPYFKNYLGYSKEKVKQILCEWEKTVEYSTDDRKIDIDKEVERLWIYKTKNTGEYDQVLEQYYGTIDLLTLEDCTKVPLNFFRAYKYLTDGSVRLYISMLNYYELFGMVEFSRSDLIECSGMSYRTITRDINSLYDMGYILKIKKNRRKGEKYKYTLNQYKLTNDNCFIAINNATIRVMIHDPLFKVTPAEFKVYSYLKLLYGLGNKIYPTREEIAEAINKDKTTISKITTSLMKKRYINKKTIKYNGKNKNIYELKM